jgi:hypothetical protein
VTDGSLLVVKLVGEPELDTELDLDLYGCGVIVSSLGVGKRGLLGTASTLLYKLGGMTSIVLAFLITLGDTSFLCSAYGKGFAGILRSPNGEEGGDFVDVDISN